MDGSVKSTHARMYQLLDKSVETGGLPHTRTARLELDYRTPEAIFLSPRTDSGKRLDLCPPVTQACRVMHINANAERVKPISQQIYLTFLQMEACDLRLPQLM